MRNATAPIAGLLLAAAAAASDAQTLDANALVDFGAVLPSNQRSFTRGGAGKLEFGASGETPRATGQALADLRLQLAPEFGFFTTVRAAPDQHAPFDVLEAYARYQTLAKKSWLWSIKAGAFFPPISLENESVGWTSPWTLTPSAINSWAGDELRTIGAESTVEWRYATGSLGLLGAVFGVNDPTGTLLAERGWAFDSRPTGLFGEPRRPDLATGLEGFTHAVREEAFKEIDGRPGWYAGGALRQDGVGRLTALYYDNRADPGASIGNDFAWRTKFTSLGAEVDIGDLVLLSQGMFGDTTIEPFDSFYSTTDFQSAYLLAGYYFGDYRAAGRVDFFATQLRTSRGAGPGEHGYAVTASAGWTPLRWMRLSAEVIRVDSDRGQRALGGVPARAVELQGQLVMRLLY